MKYTIDASGIHYEIETAVDDAYPADKPPIPIAEAVNECHKIRDKMDAALCECAAQGAPTKCGACDG
jgi:hypothetical protein